MKPIAPNNSRFVLLVALCLALAGCSPPAEDAPPAPQAGFLAAAALNADLDQFQGELEGRFAYLRAGNPDYRSAINAIRAKGQNGMSIVDLGNELLRVRGLFIDCHADIQGYELQPGFLPFRIDIVGERYAAVLPDRSAFVEPSFPFISKIDGRLLAEWVDLLRPIIAKGSPQYIRCTMLRYLQFIRFARSVARIEDGSGLTAEFESRDGGSRVTRHLAIASAWSAGGRWPDRPSRLLASNIGYLRITDWDENGSAEISRWMPQFSGTTGLIVDIRENPGGARNVGEELFAYLARAAGKPRVANAAKYRLYRDFGPDYLDSRNMHKEDWPGWTADERVAIAEFRSSFQPEWQVPENEFSDWHFWLPCKRPDSTAYDYPRPVVFLMNEKCFSASDVLLSAVKGLPNVTLIGGPSGGGSGAPVYSTLSNSQLRPYLSSMVSFQRSGLLLDGHGVEPDVALEPDPEYYLQNGPDPVLEFAEQWIRQPWSRQRPYRPKSLFFNARR
jgi:hypothetical protein